MPRLTSLVDNPTLQQQQTVPRLSFAEPAPAAPVIAPAPDRALPVWMVEDRRTYWDTIRKIQAEYDAQQKQQRENLQRYFDTEFAPQLATGVQRAQPVLDTMVRSQVEENKRAEALRLAQQERLGRSRGSQTINEQGQPETTYFGLGKPPTTDVIKDVLTTSNVVGEPIARALKSIPVVPDPQELIGLPGTSGIRKSVKDFAVDIAIPTSVWDTALTLIPAAKARTIPELLAAVSIGDVDALKAVKRVAPNLSDSAIMQGAKRALTAGESGKLEPEIIKNSIMERIRRNVPLRVEQEAVRSEERAAKSSAVGAALRSDLAPDEMFKALDAARRGALHHAEFEAFEFPAEERAWMIQQIRDYAPWGGNNLKRGSAIDAIRRVEQGFGLRAFEERNWTEVFGPEFVQSIKDRGTNSLLANIARAWATPGVDPMRPQEIVPVGERYFLPDVQQGVDRGVQAALTAKQRTGTGAYGISTRPSTLEQGLEQAMKVPPSVGPVEQTRVVQPFSNVTARAADEATASAINAVQGPYVHHDLPYDRKIVELLDEPEPLQQLTLANRLLSPIQLWRSFVTSFDNGFLGRQGWKFIPTNPVQWAGAWKRSWKAMASEQAYREIDKEVRSFSTFDLGQRMKRPLAVVTAGGGKRPSEEFMARTPRVLRPSERAYTGAANYVRQATMESDVALVREANHGHPITDKAAQQIVDNINNASLYGNIRGLKDSQSLLGSTFFSIRAKASLPAFLWDVARAMGPNTDPTVRKIIAKRFAGWLTLNLSLMYAAKWMATQNDDIDAGFDWLDSKTFGKIKHGPQTFDVWAGYAPLVRAILQTGSYVENRLHGDEETRNPSEIAGTYIENQLSPAFSTAFDFTFGGGTDRRNRDLYSNDVIGYGAEKVSPLFAYEVYEAWKANGWVGGLTGGLASFSGIGAQTITESESQKKEAVSEALQKELDAAGFPRAAVAFKQNDWQKAFKDAGFTKVGDYDTYEALKAATVDVWAPTYPSFKTKGAAEARAEAGRDFDALPVADAFKAAEKAALLSWMRNNRPLAQKAAQQGAFGELSKEEEEALGLD